VRADRRRHYPGVEELGWAGHSVERAGWHRGPARGTAKGGGRRQPGLSGGGPGEAEPSRVVTDGVGGGTQGGAQARQRWRQLGRAEAGA
jgi:hypothetical protein